MFRWVLLQSIVRFSYLHALFLSIVSMLYNPWITGISWELCLQQHCGCTSAAPRHSVCSVRQALLPGRTKTWALRQLHSTGDFALQKKADVDMAMHFSPIQGHTCNKTMYSLLNVSNTDPLICNCKGPFNSPSPGWYHWAWCWLPLSSPLHFHANPLSVQLLTCISLWFLFFSPSPNDVAIPGQIPWQKTHSMAV